MVTIHSNEAKHSNSFEIILALTGLNLMGYDKKLHNAWEDCYYAHTFLEESSLQREGNVPFYR